MLTKALTKGWIWRDLAGFGSRPRYVRHARRLCVGRPDVCFNSRFTYNAMRHTMILLIVSFRCRETEKIFRREHSRRFGNIQRVAMRRLYSLDAARKLTDLAGGGMSPEPLKGDRKGQHSIRINDQFRFCFIWTNGHVTDGEIVDYR